MKLFTRATFVGPMTLALATAGSAAAAPPGGAAQAPATCEGMEEKAPTQEEKAPTQEESRPPEAEPRREHHGPVALVGEGLSRICLSDEQRAAIEALGRRVSAKEQQVMEARRALRSALVRQIESGGIDERALTDEVDALVKAREDASPVFRKALEDLHGILDQGQRAALADAIQKRVQERTEASRGWFEAFAKELSLSEQQKNRIHEMLTKARPQLDEERATAAAVFDAFKKDDLSMEKVAPIGDVGKRTRARAEGMVRAAKELAATLTPEQRAELVKRLQTRTMKEKAKPGEAKPGETEPGEAEPEKAEPEEDEEEERSGEPSRRSQGQPAGEVQQGVVVARGYRAGAVTGWGGGYAARRTTVRAGYAAGYPLVGGYGPGIW